MDEAVGRKKYKGVLYILRNGDKDDSLCNVIFIGSVRADGCVVPENMDTDIDSGGGSAGLCFASG